MGHVARIITAVALVALALPGAVVAQNLNTVRGKIVTDQGKPGAQLLVTLETGTGILVGQVVSNAEGDFAFPGLEGESYYVIIKELDWNPVRHEINFSVTPSGDRPGETQFVSIALSPRVGARVGAGGTVFVQAVPPDAQTAYDRGQRLARETKHADAIAAFQEAIRIFPTYFDANFALASELMKTGESEGAMRALDRAREINPKDARVYSAFGAMLVKQRKYSVAAAAYGEAARLNPNDPSYPLQRATVLIDQATLLDPAKPEQAKDRATLLDAAAKDLDRAWSTSGRTLSSVHLQRARMWERAGQRGKAADALEAYLKQEPGASNAAAIRESIAKLRQP